ncbi:MAG TPA: GYDIA family GHMP kinase [Chitinophagales bacterium]|mgnify:CR=1 FL=1|nr:GYDIA family GHMP kinase [Chitinophagales bacterium]
MQQEFYAHGKLLIAGEYLILHGAMGLAIPVRYGQRMRVSTPADMSAEIHWRALTDEGKVWMDVQLRAADFAITQTQAGTEKEITQLQKILQTVRAQKPDYLKDARGLLIEHQLEFPRTWGLGSSSTLVSNVSAHAGINPFVLHKSVFNGSGYDIACARSKWPVLYRIDDEGPVYDTVHFMPPAPEQLVFVHLGKKQDTQVSVDAFLSGGNNHAEYIEIISELSEALMFCDDAADFIQLLDEHEEVMQYVLQQEKIKTQLFADFPGSVKSLGAWGGDFVLAAAPMEPTALQQYFTDKGFTTVIPYLDMFLKQ